MSKNIIYQKNTKVFIKSIFYILVFTTIFFFNNRTELTKFNTASVGGTSPEKKDIEMGVTQDGAARNPTGGAAGPADLLGLSAEGAGSRVPTLRVPAGRVPVGRVPVGAAGLALSVEDVGFTPYSTKSGNVYPLEEGACKKDDDKTSSLPNIKGKLRKLFGSCSRLCSEKLFGSCSRLCSKPESKPLELEEQGEEQGLMKVSLKQNHFSYKTRLSKIFRLGLSSTQAVSSSGYCSGIVEKDDGTVQKKEQNLHVQTIEEKEKPCFLRRVENSIISMVNASLTEIKRIEEGQNPIERLKLQKLDSILEKLEEITGSDKSKLDKTELEQVIDSKINPDMVATGGEPSIKTEDLLCLLDEKVPVEIFIYDSNVSTDVHARQASSKARSNLISLISLAKSRVHKPIDCMVIQKDTDLDKLKDPLLRGRADNFFIIPKRSFGASLKNFIKSIFWFFFGGFITFFFYIPSITKEHITSKIRAFCVYLKNLVILFVSSLILLMVSVNSYSIAKIFVKNIRALVLNIRFETLYMRTMIPYMILSLLFALFLITTYWVLLRKNYVHSTIVVSGFARLCSNIIKMVIEMISIKKRLYYLLFAFLSLLYYVFIQIKEIGFMISKVFRIFYVIYTKLKQTCSTMCRGTKKDFLKNVLKFILFTILFPILSLIALVFDFIYNITCGLIDIKSLTSLVFNCVSNFIYKITCGIIDIDCLTSLVFDFISCITCGLIDTEGIKENIPTRVECWGWKDRFEKLETTIPLNNFNHTYLYFVASKEEIQQVKPDKVPTSSLANKEPVLRFTWVQL